MRFDFPHLSFLSTDSTNLQALNYLSKTSPQPGFMLIADYQTDGKGQFGRNWESASGKNLLCSYIFGPLNWSLDHLFNLHLISALSVLNLLREHQIPNLTVKWPNDIYTGSKKIAGILIQNIIKENCLQWTVLGIGINVNQSVFSEGLNASSMNLETGIAFSIDKLAMDLRDKLMQAFQSSDEVQTNWLKSYNNALYAKDQWKRILMKDEEPFLAKILYATSEGSLIIEKQNGERIRIIHGEAHMDV